MIAIEVSNLRYAMDALDKKITSDCYKALTYTASDTKDLILSNWQKKKNAYNETLDKEAQSTIDRKGFSHPLINTRKMYWGLRTTKLSDTEVRIEFSDKNYIYKQYLNSREDKNWHLLVATDYIKRKIKQFFKKNYGR